MQLAPLHEAAKAAKESSHSLDIHVQLATLKKEVADLKIKVNELESSSNKIKSVFTKFFRNSGTKRQAKLMDEEEVNRLIENKLRKRR